MCEACVKHSEASHFAVKREFLPSPTLGFWCEAVGASSLFIILEHNTLHSRPRGSAGPEVQRF